MIPSSTFNASDGAAYEQMMGRWSQRLAEPFLDVAGPVADGHILDVGCGTGSLTLALARRSPNSRVQGLDYSPTTSPSRGRGRTIRASPSSRATPARCPSRTPPSTRSSPS